MFDRATIWEKVKNRGFTKNERTGCLEYNGYKNHLGYGSINSNGRHNKVHRLAYEFLVGPLLDTEVVMHLCDNPRCSEPSHLKKGSQKDNLQDMWKKGRGYKTDWTACPKGHPYPPDLTTWSKAFKCKICADARQRRYREKRKVNGLESSKVPFKV